MTSRRGAGAVERGGLENRWRPKGRPWVQIPPPPLATDGAQRRPSRRTWARISAPSLMLRTASARPSPAATADEDGVSAAGISAMVASSRKSGIPKRRARTEAWTSPPSELRLEGSTAAVNATGAEAIIREAESRFTNPALSAAATTR